MSALGHSLRSQTAFAPSLSAMPPGATKLLRRSEMTQRANHVISRRSKQRAIDHLVGAGEQRRRQVRPSALAVLKLIASLVLGRRLYRQVGRLLALKDAIDVAGRAPVLVNIIGP